MDERCKDVKCNLQQETFFAGLMKSLVQAKHTMLSVWKVAASATEPWTSNLDGVVKKLVDNFVKLFSVILDCPSVVEALERQQLSRPNQAVQTASLFQVRKSQSKKKQTNVVAPVL
jgi:hypothetical protein